MTVTSVFEAIVMTDGLDLSELSVALPAPTEDGILTVVVNGEAKVVHHSWLVDGGRAAGSALAKQILGTMEGLHGSGVIHVEAGCETFDRICGWLEHGDDHILKDLTHENAPALVRAAGYFCLDRLLDVVDVEMRRRIQCMEDALYPLERDVKMWRDLHAKIHAAKGEDQGSNTAPAYASYIYEHRNSFNLVHKGAAERVLVEPAFSEYMSQLTAEIQKWEQHFQRYASLQKASGNVVYQHRQVSNPGYCVPSLLPSTAGPEPRKLVAGAIGDRVKENERPSRHPRYGKIISITDDNGTEISVKWDDGSVSRNLHCGKKGGFALVYA